MQAKQKAIIRRASAKARLKIKSLDKEVRGKLTDLYRQARDDVERSILAAEAMDGTLKIESLARLKQQINAQLERITLSRDELLGLSLRQAVDSGVNPFASVGLALDGIAEDALIQTVNFVAQDGLQLSDRLWRLNNHAREIITNQVEQAIIRGDSAVKASRDFINKGLTVPADLQRKIGQAQAHKIAQASGRELMKKGGPYANALRVFRTEINRAHGEAYQAAAFDSPDVVGTQFLLSPNHPETDICDMHANVNRYGLGKGVYPKGKNPWPAHPNTLSFTVVVFDDEVTDADRAGKQNRIEWLKNQPPGTQYDVLNSSKKVAALDRDLLKESQIATPWKVLKKYYERKGHDPSSWSVSTPKPLPPVESFNHPTNLDDFEPAKTVQEASRWAMQQGIVDYADYSGSSLAVANDWNRSVHFHVKLYPQLRDNLKFIGTTQARNRRWHEHHVRDWMAEIKLQNPGFTEAEYRKFAERYVKKPRVNGRTYAVSTPDPVIQGVSVNSKWSSKLDDFTRALANDVNSKFHPVGTDNVKSVIDHELGHQMDDLLGIRKLPEVQELYANWVYNDIEGNELSRYARKNIAEFIAEGWAEYLNNPQPRALAQSLGTIINREYRRLYNG